MEDFNISETVLEKVLQDLQVLKERLFSDRNDILFWHNCSHDVSARHVDWDRYIYDFKLGLIVPFRISSTENWISN